MNLQQHTTKDALKEMQIELHNEINLHRKNIKRWRVEQVASTDTDEIDKYGYAIDMTHTLIDRKISQLQSIENELFDLLERNKTND